MDIHMPRMGGLETIAAIRSGRHGPADIPVIALTANTGADEGRRLIAAGFDSVEGKPIDANALIGSISALRTRAPAFADETSARASPPLVTRHS